MKSSSTCNPKQTLKNWKNIPIRFVMKSNSTYADTFGYSRQEPAQCCKRCAFYSSDRFIGENRGSCKYHDFLLESVAKDHIFDFDNEENAFDDRGYGICPHYCSLVDMLNFKNKSYDELILDQSIRAGTGPEESLFIEILDGKENPDIRKATDKMMRYVKTILKNSEILDPGFPPVMIKSDCITPTGYVYHVDLSTNFDRVRAFIAKNDKAAKELFGSTYSRKNMTKGSAYRYGGMAIGSMLGSDFLGSYAGDALKQMMDTGLYDDPKEMEEVLKKNFSYIIQ